MDLVVQSPVHKVKQHRLHRIAVMLNNNVTDKDTTRHDTKEAHRTVSMQKSQRVFSV